MSWIWYVIISVLVDSLVMFDFMKDSALFDDLPVNSNGEFLSDTPSTSPELDPNLPVDADGQSEFNTPSISSEMYNDLPVNSAGEFISSTPSLICWENHCERPPNSAGGYIGNAPSISPHLAARSLHLHSMCESPSCYRAL